MKSVRQKAIIEIISQNDVDTQQRLAELLRAKGFEVTQATVSRDIKEMALIKVPTEHNTCKYALPNINTANPGLQKINAILHDSIVSAEVAMNLLVIKTYPGMANAVCAAMDQLSLEGVVGTIAGDDTIFMAIRSTEQASALQQKIIKLK